MTTGIFFFRVEKGKVKLYDQRAFAAWVLQSMKDGDEGMLEIGGLKERYTLAQLRYLHVSVYKPVGDKLGLAPPTLPCRS